MTDLPADPLTNPEVNRLFEIGEETVRNSERIAMALESLNDNLTEILEAIKWVIENQVPTQTGSTMVPLDDEPEQPRWIERAVAIYGENALIAMDKYEKAKKFLKWAVENKVSPVDVTIGADGILAVENTVVTEYRHQL